ncbi:unnamed protein product [Cylicocyclus nassatus]|uniref:Uncharacterized protein n=1 Tax=Cylicocyclus nassatus TaxID=53992 RepID=A0AA36GT01_CYLNA|nr:unnamed protein product [Cylicocyclus nassatus]
MNLLFFFFFLGACFLGLTNATTCSPAEMRRFMVCMEKCKADKLICRKRCHVGCRGLKKGRSV